MFREGNPRRILILRPGKLRTMFLRLFLKTVSIAVLASLGITTLAAQKAKPYLALGDSVPFGFNPTIPLPPPLPIGDDYHGYPQFVAAGASPSLDLANASCVGETSTSFLTVGAPDLGCQAWRAAKLPMWVTYSSLTESQMDFAVAYLRANPKTQLVTITIGGNDLGLLQANCTTPNASATDIQNCMLAGAPAVYATFATNLWQIYSKIRHTANYQGQIVAVNYFSFNYSDPFITGLLATLDAIMQGITGAFGGQVADAFLTFQARSASSVPPGYPCALDPPLAFVQSTNPLTCNPHPTTAGHQLISKLVLDLLH